MSNWNAIAVSARNLLASQDGLTISATWGNAVFSAIRTTIRRQDVNTDEGLIAGRYTFSILVDKSALPSIPSRRDKIAIDGMTYRVLATETDAIGAIVRIDLGDILQ